MMDEKEMMEMDEMMEMVSGGTDDSSSVKDSDQFSGTDGAGISWFGSVHPGFGKPTRPQGSGTK